MSNEYDVVILGGGTGGYVAAIRASQLGMKVAIVEQDKLGGTCLHQGCIPSKALLRSAEVFHTLKNAKEYGVFSTDLGFDFGEMQERKQKIVDRLYQGVLYLIKKGKIDVFKGKGRIMGSSIFSPRAGVVTVEQEEGESPILIPKYVLIATGSRPRLLPGLPKEESFMITSEEALQMEKLPASIIIVGGGVIGVEWASLLNDLGVHVEIVEAEDRLLPLEDEDVSRELERIFKKRNITIHTGAVLKTEEIKKENNLIIIKVEKNKKEYLLSSEKILLSIGRQANVEDIGLNNIDVNLENGCIQVNTMFQTGEKHIYAIGDVIGGMQLAHVAAREGIVAVEHMAGLHPQPLQYRSVPKCVYGRPEIASIGLTTKEAEAAGYSIKTGKFDFRAIGKALVYGEHEGFVKLVMDKGTQDILGIHMIGPHVTELIGEGALAKVLDATPGELADTIHPHPSLSEIIGEAALAIEGKQIHS